MSDIVLTTFNARYPHTAFGLRYLMSNLGELQSQAEILEFSLGDNVVWAIEAVLKKSPKIVGLGVYIWNVDQATQFAAGLKRLRPDIHLILGGPEVSYDLEGLEIAKLADHILPGEADLRFAALCGRLLERSPKDHTRDGTRAEEWQDTLEAYPTLPTFDQLQLPYGLYTDEDLQHRTVYVEASRGCPYRCEFCLSSLEIPVRQVDIDRFLSEMQQLLDRGARQFKFIDRTFNLHLRISQRILQFFLDRNRPGMFLHFEMVPDRLPAPLRETILRFPSGTLQFEIGVQTFNDEVAARIQRRQDISKLEDNLRFLREQTGVHLHVDLIVGLPGETLESFGAGFSRLIALRPQEIQVGLLKRLRGTPIIRHDREWEMVYNPHAPYEILQNRSIDFSNMQRLRRFSRYWDLIGNSGNFRETCPMIWEHESPFDGFLRLSDWLHVRLGQTHQIALPRMVDALFEFLVQEKGHPARQTAERLLSDYYRSGRKDRPSSLVPFLPKGPPSGDPHRQRPSNKPPPRQLRHGQP
jgi:radical SAM superfamily enzyme YgiQ (UPF0313 family)